MLKSIQLSNFRSYVDLKFDFDPKLTVLVGANGSGKTSVIEALNLISTGGSFRAGRVEEMVSFDEELGKVKVMVMEDDEAGVGNESEHKSDGNSDELDELEILLTRGILQGKRTQYKHFRMNGVKKRRSGVTGKFLSVVFRPEDLRLIEGSPGRRRAFLNEVLSGVSGEYDRSLTAYERTLARRNKLLQAVREGDQPKTTLQFWNMSLIKHGEILQAERRHFLEFTSAVDFPISFRVQYQPSIITEDRVSEYLDRAIAAGHTLIGPHKDDFVVETDVTNLHRGDLSEFHDIAAYGSRGQQRLSVLWLKTCQIKYLEQKFDERPILLLDDILSELDDDSKTVVKKLIANHQSVLTTADEEGLKEIGVKGVRVNL